MSVTIKRHEESLERFEDFNHYVYEHYADGKLIYVGKGSGERRRQSGSRSKSWYTIAESADLVEFKVVGWRDTHEEALALERQVYLSHLYSGADLLTNATTPSGADLSPIKEHWKLQAEIESLKKNTVPKDQLEKALKDVENKDQWIRKHLGKVAHKSNNNIAHFTKKHNEQIIYAKNRIEWLEKYVNLLLSNPGEDSLYEFKINSDELFHHMHDDSLFGDIDFN